MFNQDIAIENPYKYNIEDRERENDEFEKQVLLETQKNI